jgi:hypothetical protein
MKRFNPGAFLILAASVLCLCSCDKIAEKAENYDLFGLEQANEGMKIQQEKIKAAREYQKGTMTLQQDAYNSPSILGGKE